MSKVYVVSRGEYSDFRVCGVVANEQDAKDYCSKFNDADYSERELGKLDFSRDQQLLYDVWVMPNGELFNHPSPVEDYSYENKFQNTIHRYSDKHILYVWASNIEHAKKVAAEKFAMFKSVKETHFPLYDIECVQADDCSYRPSYPKYDMTTFEIVLRSDEKLIGNCQAKTRKI